MPALRVQIPQVSSVEGTSREAPKVSKVDPDASFSPGFVEQGYSCKAYVILFIIVVDCFISGWTDHLWSVGSITILKDLT